LSLSKIATQGPNIAALHTTLAVAALFLSACTGNTDMRPITDTLVDGRMITVSQSTTDKNIWSAFGSSMRDRASVTTEYLRRNVRAIEALSGCKVNAATTNHVIVTTITSVDWLQ